MKTTAQVQEEVRDYWDARPCNSELSTRPVGTRDYYLEIEKSRYGYEYHIPGILSALDLSGRKVLEIGTGVGTDARLIISRGGLYTGVNIDHGSCDATRKALTAFGLEGSLHQASATSLPFTNGRFDIVYTFGVLMCIPEADRAVAEIRRVLRPGGALLLMVYNRDSINYRVEIMFLRKLFLKLILLPGMIPLFSRLGFPEDKLRRHVELHRTHGHMSDEEWLSRNTDGPDHPYTIVYSAAEIEQRLSGFKIIANEVYFFDPRHYGLIGRLMPAKFLDFLGRRWGWHRVVHAKRLPDL